MQSRPSSSWLSRCCVTKLNPLCGYSSFQEFVELVCTIYTQALFLFPIMWVTRLINYLWPTYVHFPVLIITSNVVVLQFLLSVDLVLCPCTKQALFLVMSLWPLYISHVLRPTSIVAILQSLLFTHSYQTGIVPFSLSCVLGLWSSRVLSNRVSEHLDFKV